MKVLAGESGPVAGGGGRRALARAVCGAVAAAFMLACCGSALAVPVFYEFEAQVVRTDTDFVSVGDAFTGTFGYDTDSILMGPTSSNFYTAFQPASIFGLHLSIGPDDLPFDSYNVGVTQAFGGLPAGAHMFNIATFGPGSSPEWPSGPRVNIQITLTDSSGTAIQDLALPRHLDLEDFDRGEIVIANVPLGTETPRWRFDSEIVSLRVLVPEPSTAPLLGLGALLLAKRGGSRRRPC